MVELFYGQYKAEGTNEGRDFVHILCNFVLLVSVNDLSCKTIASLIESTVEV
jgi:hypothetical protein